MEEIRNEEVIDEVVTDEFEDGEEGTGIGGVAVLALVAAAGYGVGKLTEKVIVPGVKKGASKIKGFFVKKTDSESTEGDGEPESEETPEEATPKKKGGKKQ